MDTLRTISRSLSARKLVMKAVSCRSIRKFAPRHNRESFSEDQHRYEYVFILK